MCSRAIQVSSFKHNICLISSDVTKTTLQYHGKRQPNSFNEYLEQFVIEADKILEHGVIYLQRRIKVEIEQTSSEVNLCLCETVTIAKG